MKKIKKDELYKHLSEFLEHKGVKLEKGSFAKRVRQGCGLLTEAINVSQTAYGRAKTEMDKTLEQMKQAIKKAKSKAPPKVTPSPFTNKPPKKAAPKKAKKAAKKTAVKVPKKKAVKKTSAKKAPAKRARKSRNAK